MIPPRGWKICSKEGHLVIFQMRIPAVMITDGFKFRFWNPISGDILSLEFDSKEQLNNSAGEICDD